MVCVNCLALYPVARYYSSLGWFPYAKEIFYTFSILVTILLFVCFTLSGFLRAPISAWFFILYLIYTSIVIIFSFFTKKILEPVLAYEFLIRDLVFTLTSFGWFMSGYYLNNISKNKNIFLYFFIFYILNVFFNIDLQSLKIDLTGLNDETGASYQYWGDALAMLSIIVLANLVNKSILFKLFFIFITTVGLFALLSRTSLYFYLIIAPLFFLNDFYKRPITTLNILFGLLVSILFLPEIIKILPFTDGSRMLAFLSLESDSSYSQRQILNALGNEVIRKNLIFGDYAHNASQFGLLGYYTHDIRDVWGQFGLLPFIFLSFSIITAFFSGLSQAFIDKKNTAPFYLLLFSILCWIFSRNQSFVHLFLPLGLIASNHRKV